MPIAIEAAELMERFQWLTTEEAQEAVADPQERAAVADELADIIIYCLSLSNALDLEFEKVFSCRRSLKLPHDIQQVALRKLRMLNRSVTLNDLRVPSANRLEKLKGDRAGQVQHPHQRTSVCRPGASTRSYWASVALQQIPPCGWPATLT
jgi:hypothetical protein